MLRLREETSGHHQRAEAAASVDQMLVDRTTYASGLIRFYRVWRPLENAIIGSCLDLPPKVEERWRSAKLEGDLTMLGTAVSEIAMEPLGYALETQAQVTGALYVMEGSTLGGQIVARMISERLGLISATGASFFTAHGPDTSARWKEFTEWAPASIPESDFSDCVASAQRTFETIEHSFLS
ncbi:biliverdin-producing heme oxygenase [bacterium]|nr:biliverdin-producing heme oxygenase [bacterium]